MRTYLVQQRRCQRKFYYRAGNGAGVVLNEDLDEDVFHNLAASQAAARVASVFAMKAERHPERNQHDRKHRALSSSGTREVQAMRDSDSGTPGWSVNELATPTGKDSREQMREGA